MNVLCTGTPRSSIPGRIRWDARERLCGQPRIAAGVETTLENIPEIHSARANTVTGRLLVKFDIHLSVSDVAQLIKKALQHPMTDVEPRNNKKPEHQLILHPKANNNISVGRWIFDLLTSVLRSYLVLSLMRL
ncbi:MAG: heavy-metal-associated domain-containing protein [Desulfobacteraceae bacterium]|nr:heavy-metal-associated domain-containing protein [Desulfobacteraceae bacterium]